MLEPMSFEEAKKIILRQQEDLQNLTIIIEDSAKTIQSLSEETTRLLMLCAEKEKVIAKLNEVIHSMQSEHSQEYRIDASKRGERLD